MKHASTGLWRQAAVAALVSFVAVSVGGCATSALTQARTADELHDYDVAVAEYMKELRLHPDSREAALGLDRAKLRASEAHLVRGRRLDSLGRYDDAVVELQLASELNPTNGDAERELRTARAALRAKLAAPAEGQTALESLLAKTRDMAPAGFDLPDLKLGQIQTGTQATSRQLYLMIARAANISVAFDPTFRDATAQAVLLNNMTVREALAVVARSTGTFFQVTGANTITVVPDNQGKRREYTEEVIRTFVVQNADLKETMDALRVVTDIRNISQITGTNTILARDTPERLAAAAKFLTAFDKARPEVVVDVEILEVDRTKLKEYGLQIASANSTGISGSVSIDDTNLTAKSLRTLTNADVMISGIPALYYRLLKTDTNTRTLANPHLRMLDGIAASEEFGDSVPIPRTVLQAIATGGVQTQPITTYDYKNIGVNISITPRTHANDDVTLALTVELTTASSPGFGGLPGFGNRKVSTTIRLKDGETNILAGLIRADERFVKDGIPGLSDIPGLKHLFTKSHKEATETDVVIMLTPHIVRVLSISAEDLRPLRLQRDGTGAALVEGPSVPVPPIIRGGGGTQAPQPQAAETPSGVPLAPGLFLGPLPVAPVPAPPPLVIKKR